MHDHAHHGEVRQVSRRLIWATAITLGVVVVELLVGWATNSLALVADAFHNVTDAIALLLALLAVRLEKSAPTDQKSFGYQRAGILTAFVNAGTLVALTIYLIVEAVDRFRHPLPIGSGGMLAVAIGGLLINLGLAVGLRGDSRHDVNIRSAVVHLMADAVASAGVIAAALLIAATGRSWWDPAVTIAIAFLILWSSWGILKETINLLLEGTPSGIDPAAVTASLGAIEGVEGVHHLHIWALGPSRPALSCHLMVGDIPLRSTSSMLEQVNQMLRRDYGIVHATIQFEFSACGPDDLYCVPYTAQSDTTTHRPHHDH